MANKTSRAFLAACVAGALISPIWGQAPAATKKPTPSAKPAAGDVDYFTPSMIIPGAMFGTVASHRIAVDILEVGDYDMVLLVNNLMKVMVDKNLITLAEAKTLVDGAKIKKPLRVAGLSQPAKPAGKVKK